MEKRDAKVLKHVARSLRLRTGMEMKPFGRACRIDQANISRYELGRVAPSDETLRRMAEVAKVPWDLVLSMIRFFTDFLAAADRDLAPVSPTGPPACEHPTLDAVFQVVGAYLIREGLTAADGPTAEQAVREAQEVCAGLLPLPAAERRRLLALTHSASRSWALAAELAHASERAAREQVEEAEELAELALYVARQVPQEARRARTEGRFVDLEASLRR